jgi:TRAP-type mannitol/chloroaromatic compound transport system permease large subunit
MVDIYKSIIPFVIVEIAALIIVIVFPELATYLPALMLQH